MKKIILLLCFIPLLLKAQSKRDTQIIHNLIMLQIPELLIQKKPEEMGKLVTDTYTQINYINGVKDQNVIYGKQEAIEYFKNLTTNDFKSISFSIENLKIYTDKAIATGHYLITYKRSDLGVQKADFVITLLRGTTYPWLIDQVVDIVY